MATSRPSGLYPDASGALAGAAHPAARGRTRARAAARTVAARPSKACALAIEGLATQSKAPSSSACKDASAPRPVSVETMTTGIGRRRMIFSRNSRPFMAGISTSSVTTSGFSALMAWRASAEEAACPTTSMPGSRRKVAVTKPRMVAESSTTSTRIIARPPARAGGRSSGRHARNTARPGP